VLGASCTQEEQSPKMIEKRFMDHVVEFGHSYGTREEFEFRMNIFAQHDASINTINMDEGASFYLEHNQFSTMTPNEKAKMMGKKPTLDISEEHEEELETVSLAAGVDWRTKGAVNPVQNQGQCGSCWAFSATAAMEGEHFIKTGTLLKLSEQQFVDCDTQSSGCNGGLEAWAFEYAEKHAQELESAYPYKGKNGKCQATAAKGKVSAKSYKTVPARSTAQLKAAIAVQPTCVSVDAEDDQFMFYKGGILNTKTCGTDLDHAITAVGYGTESGKNFFIVRNSWGSSWGEKGYIRMSADVGGAGVCGVLLDSTRPVTN
jgi:KDEL-tailed cysteine endopeptidase